MRFLAKKWARDKCAGGGDSLFSACRTTPRVAVIDGDFENIEIKKTAVFFVMHKNYVKLSNIKKKIKKKHICLYLKSIKTVRLLLFLKLLKP